MHHLLLTNIAKIQNDKYSCPQALQTGSIMEFWQATWKDKKHTVNKVVLLCFGFCLNLLTHCSRLSGTSGGKSSRVKAQVQMPTSMCTCQSPVRDRHAQQSNLRTDLLKTHMAQSQGWRECRDMQTLGTARESVQ